jgi:hypothetical protein
MRLLLESGCSSFAAAAAAQLQKRRAVVRLRLEEVMTQEEAALP